MDINNTLFDVAVVGYGPVGQAMAIALAQHGFNVIAIERWPALYSLPRAVGYDHEVSRILQALGVAQAIAPHTASLKTYEWRSASGQPLKTFHGLDQIGISGWPNGTACCQPSIEAVLDARVRTFDNIVVLQGWEVHSLEQGDAVSIRAAQIGQGAPRDAAGASLTIEARYVVGCDGASSVVRRTIAAANGDSDEGYEDLGFNADWLVVDIKPRNANDWNNDQLQICDPRRPTTLVCGGPGRRRAEFMLLPSETKEAMSSPEQAWRLLAAHGWTPDNAELERQAVYSFRGCVARRWRQGRILLAGDAAHLTPPFAGQGLCAGLRDVAALSWRLQQVLRGIARPEILESYGLERAGQVRRFIEFAIELGRVVCVLDPDIAAQRDAALLSRSEEDRWPPPRVEPSELFRAADAHAGTLGLQAVVHDGARQGLFDDIVGHGFVLLAQDQDALQALDEGHWRFLRQIGAHCVTLTPDGLIDIEGRYKAWLAELGGRCVLVRPDFYVYGVGDPNVLVDALRNSGVWLATHEAGPSAEAVQGSTRTLQLTARGL
jgi:2-polyprenyl-6-methoxyphenol hydroxylase-like FAD-dependent oxidoreductase